MYSIIHIGAGWYVYSRGKSLPNGRKYARFDTFRGRPRLPQGPALSVTHVTLSTATTR